MKTLTILLLLAATNFAFASGMRQDLTDCGSGSADNAVEQAFESTPAPVTSTSGVVTLGE